jgi:hypothetical protein
LASPVNQMLPLPVEAGGLTKIPTSSQAGSAVPRLFFSVESALDTIARAVPGTASRIDRIKTELRAILAELPELSGAQGNPGGMTSPMGPLG